MLEQDQGDELGEELLDLGTRQVIAVGGGKGGVGKSFVSANLAVGLAQRGHSVIVMDADLGGANMHTCLGIPHPTCTLADFIENRVATLDEVLLDTPIPRLRILCGASDILSLANPQYSQKQKIIRHLKRLKSDYLLLDLGAGTSFNVLDFFNLAPRKLIVVTPEPTSIQNGYGFLKSALTRHLARQFASNYLVSDLLKGTPVPGINRPVETIKQILDVLQERMPPVAERARQIISEYRVKVILNMASPPTDAKVFSILRAVATGHLQLELELLGSIPRDERVPRSVDQMSPILLSYPDADPARKLRQISDKVEGWVA